MPKKTRNLLMLVLFLLPLKSIAVEYEMMRSEKIKISIPAGWDFKEAAKRDIPNVKYNTNYTVTNDGVKIEITGVRLGKGVLDTEDKLNNALVEGGEQYLLKAKENRISPISISNKDLIGSYAELNCASENKCFRVFRDSSWNSVITATLRVNNVFFYISAGLDSDHPDKRVALLDILRSIGPKQ
ncbi:MAG: hypothetical protein ABJI60_06475 [Kangiellaceae bacterium]